MEKETFVKYEGFKTYNCRNEDVEVLGLSGGRSSAYLLMMLLNGGFNNGKNIISFQNTGKEDETCYKFLKDLEDYTGLKFTWLEYSLTDKFINELVWSSFSYEKFNNGGYTHIGEILDIQKLQSFVFNKSPNNFWYKEGYYDAAETIKVVNYETASRNGKPFTDLFIYKCAIRIMKGMGLILPTAAQRWCTGDMKEKVLDRYLRNNGIKTYTKYLGIRADEPDRAGRLMQKSDGLKHINIDMPLYFGGVNKSDVLKAWGSENIDLGLKENGDNIFKDVIGNCSFCHLKALIKKQWLIQNGYSVSFYKQIETIVNNYNGDTDCMNRYHGTYSAIETKALSMDPISLVDVMSDEEIEFQCTNCGD